MTHLLFAGHHYYPKGGIDDLVARGSIEELKQYFQTRAQDIADRRGGYIDNWGQIVDATTMLCVLRGEMAEEHATPEWEKVDPLTVDASV